jgi:hypothetical protein
MKSFLSQIPAPHQYYAFISIALRFHQYRARQEAAKRQVHHAYACCHALSSTDGGPVILIQSKIVSDTYW